jgi:hypothetical protein
MAKKSLEELINDTDVWCQKWYGTGKEASERGDYEYAERCYDKASFGLAV